MKTELTALLSLNMLDGTAVLTRLRKNDFVYHLYSNFYAILYWPILYTWYIPLAEARVSALQTAQIKLIECAGEWLCG